MNMKNTVLVTGATGNIGSRVVKELSKSHINIRAGVHSPDRIEPIKDSSAELVEIDFNRRETVPPALKGVEKLFILTPLVPNMVEIGIQLVEEAKKAGVRYIVRSSALGADTEPSITLGEWHGAIDKAVVESGIPYTILRPNSFMQNYSNMYARNLKTQSEFYLPLGDGKVSLVDTRDIAAVAAAILTPTPDAFNQTLMAAPIIILYEGGLIAARIFIRGKKKDDNDKGEESESGGV